MRRAPSILTVMLKEVTISVPRLIDLAGEYGGRALEPVGDGDDAQLDIEFSDIVDSSLGLKVSSAECLKGLMAALATYRRPKTS